MHPEREASERARALVTRVLGLGFPPFKPSDLDRALQLADGKQ